MAAEPKRKRGELTIRAFLEADAAAVTEILRTSPEASQWTEWGFQELLGWRGVLALVSEDDREVTGFLIDGNSPERRDPQSRGPGGQAAKRRRHGPS